VATWPPLDPAGDDPRLERLLVGAIIGCALLLWGAPLPASFWIDETYTGWVLQGASPSETWERAVATQNSSPLYFLLLWPLAQLGRAEALLRLPSVLCMALAAWLLHRVARRLLPREAALTAVLLFVVSDPVILQASNARGYALGMIGAVGATLFLLRGLEGRLLANGAAYVGLLLLAVYAQPLFGLVGLAHLVFVARPPSSSAQRPGPAALAAIALAVIAGAAPDAARVVAKVGGAAVGGDAWVIAGPSLLQLLNGLLPLYTAVGVVAGLLLAALLGCSFALRERPEAARSLPALTAWWLLPTLTLYLIASASFGTFEPRYFLPAAAGLALAVAWGVAWLRDPRARRLVVIAVVALAFANHLNTSLLAFRHGHHNQDLRGALAYADAATEGEQPVLVCSGAGSGFVTLQTDPVLRGYALAPVACYPLESPARLAPMAIEGPTLTAHVEATLLPELREQKRFALLLDSTSGPAATTPAWLLGRLGPTGFTVTRRRFGVTTVYLFERETPQRPDGD
jgi:hypothetical protein